MCEASRGGSYSFYTAYGQKGVTAMTFTNIHDLSDHIKRYHSSFAGHRIAPACANVRVFGTLIRFVDQLNKEPAMVGATFEAVLYTDGISVPTEIEINRIGSGYEYIERVKC